MRKFLSPILTILSLILLGIAFGLGGITAAHDAAGNSIGSYYQIVWHNPVAINVVGFFLLCFAPLFALITFLPWGRKFFALIAGALSIGAGVLALLAPSQLGSVTSVYNQPGLIGMATLLFVAGAFLLIMAVIEFMPKEK